MTQDLKIQSFTHKMVWRLLFDSFASKTTTYSSYSKYIGRIQLLTLQGGAPY